MTTLTVELSSGRGSVALFADGTLVKELQFANDRKDSGAYFAALRTLDQKATSIARIVVGLGPGSYAGVRIALASSQGLAAAHRAQLVGMNSLRALECDASDYHVIGDARRGAFFIATIYARDIADPPRFVTAAELRERVSEADLPVFRTASASDFDDVPLVYPSAARLAELCHRVDASDRAIEPIYLREPHITVPK